MSEDDADPASEDEAVDEGTEEPTESEPADESDPFDTLDALEHRVDRLETAVEDAETEADLDEAEADLADIRETVETATLPDPYPPEDADEEDELDEDDLIDPAEELEDALDDLQSDVDDQRGPYAEDAVSEFGAAASDVEDTRWAEEGEPEVRDAVENGVDDVTEILGTNLTVDAPGSGDESDAVVPLVEALADVEAAIEGADLHPDEDADAIAALLEAADDLQSGVDDATAWNDLPVREQLRREGFYDVLDHVKDFPPEWQALKVHKKRGDVEMILLALDALDSDFMEGHCLEALERMGPAEAIDPVLELANRRDQRAISILGKIGVADESVVETLLGYVDANDPLLRTTTYRALGEIGTEEAVEPIADELVADDDRVRSSAARALGMLGDTRAIPALEARLAADDSDAVRASAAWALNQIGTAEALEAVAAYADDRAYLVQAEAERAV